MPRPLSLVFKFLAGCLAAGAGLAVLLWIVAHFFSRGVSTPPVLPSPAEGAAARIAREARLNPENPPILWRDVDYREGPRAAWWPKGESPLLAELVRAGKLPPVAERTGPEPLVIEGVDGIGRYGGTWHRLAVSPQDLEGVLNNRYSYISLVRWSPQGYPIVPHLAKSWSASPDLRVWTFTLRRGLRWSDGHPFTSDDILYWWEQEKLYFKTDYQFMNHVGKIGRIEKIDDLTLRFVFEDPYSSFLEKLACSFDYFRPAHYLKKFHPAIGDPSLIASTMQALNLPSPFAVYMRLQHPLNPECPRLWPWIYADYRASAPQALVRNPYYYAVDPQGNQLPYLDRFMTDIKSKAMITAAAAGGEVTMQDRHLEFEDYTLLSGEAPRRGYRLLHWFNATRAMAQLHVNLNRTIDPRHPETKWKARLLGEKTFRQALSLALRRQDIISAVFNGVGEPAQNSPGPLSPYQNARQFHSFTAYDPAQANALLDGLGLTQRDSEGFRTFPDGTRMAWLLNISDQQLPDAVNMIASQWAEVGIRATVQIHIRTLWQVEQMAGEHDFTVAPGLEEFMPIIDPRVYAPINPYSLWASKWGRWYLRGGLQGNPDATLGGIEAPPPDHPARRAMELYDLARIAPTLEERYARIHELLDLVAENLWTITIATPPPMLAVVQDGFHNVPTHALSGALFNTPGNLGIETFFWDAPNDTPAAIAQIKDSLAHPSSLPRAAATADSPATQGAAARLLSWGLWLAGGLSVVLLAMRHPFIWRRLLTIVPSLLVISIIVFTLVQLPPGDFVTSKAMELELNGDASGAAQLQDIRETFHFDSPPWQQYLRWMGFPWFASFSPGDTGLLQGNLGRSMERNQSVNEILGDSILLTVVISLFTIVFTWAVALPIGIYSAVKPYTLSDYGLTLVGFIGMSVPPFLFALVLMYASSEYFGVSISGLFSVRYAADPVWSWGKFVDLLQHIWVPVVVLGTGSTAVMIRVMRANLLDELKKPYVVAARAKGVRPLKLLLKYPVRMALNPFVSGLATLFPQLISGGAIVALVLSLPTVGPMLMLGLMNEDTYFAASMLMILSVLGALGTLVSDLLLLWLDPRIRFGAGSK